MDQLSQGSIEKLLSELEAIAEKLEKGDIPFDQALSEYKKGLELLTECRVYLKEAENTVRILHEHYYQSIQ